MCIGFHKTKFLVFIYSVHSYDLDGSREFILIIHQFTSTFFYSAKKTLLTILQLFLRLPVPYTDYDNVVLLLQYDVNIAYSRVLTVLTNDTLSGGIHFNLGGGWVGNWQAHEVPLGLRACSPRKYSNLEARIAKLVLKLGRLKPFQPPYLCSCFFVLKSPLRILRQSNLHVFVI